MSFIARFRSLVSCWLGRPHQALRVPQALPKRRRMRGRLRRARLRHELSGDADADNAGAVQPGRHRHDRWRGAAGSLPGPGIINKRTGVDGFPYGDSFEVRLPVSGQWNGRFMFQGGGGTEGAVPPAIGVAGTLSPTLAHGLAVASQDGGHENKDLPLPNQFFLDPQAIEDHAYR